MIGMPLWMSVTHGFITLVIFVLLQVQFPFMAAAAASVMPWFPIFDPILAVLPWALGLLATGQTLWAVALLVLMYAAFSTLDGYIYDQAKPAVPPYFMAMATALGFSTYGMKGVILGPLILVLGKTMFDVAQTLTGPPTEAAEK